VSILGRWDGRRSGAQVEGISSKWKVFGDAGKVRQ